MALRSDSSRQLQHPLSTRACHLMMHLMHHEDSFVLSDGVVPLTRQEGIRRIVDQEAIVALFVRVEGRFAR